ncbi:hypothetical protein CTEN210_12862 [Chaetoceros tenuissimus]|uniref:Uncharacterized protein n=1 Tax=Chaetoceros tenuissimus TaxID=426638 RepID=A0AAD3HAP2_9STRA|nr:hypothetical protein CTEN210_12862 [Chaetoceros tenuissimus]
MTVTKKKAAKILVVAFLMLCVGYIYNEDSKLSRFLSSEDNDQEEGTSSPKSCDGWCHPHSDPWDMKCTFKHCNGCDQCLEDVPAVKVFYNVYTSDSSQDQIEASKSIVDEQMKLILPFHKVLVRYIGTKIDIDNSETLRFDEEGNEKGTLELLYNHCKENLEDTVTYIHNKGSFHPSAENDALRKFLTRGALSQECASMPDTCNVCSSRMSPYPHPHTSGNMWTAKCDYIQKLYDPYEFEERMTNLYKEVLRFSCSNMGCDRYASEHWVHSHPSVKPCDLSDDSRFVWNYSNIPPPDFKK